MAKPAQKPKTAPSAAQQKGKVQNIQNAKAQLARRQKGANKKTIPVKYIVLLVVVMTAMLMFLPFTVVLLAGMAPTITIYIADRERDPMAPLTMGSMNICGVVPVIFGLWTTDARMRDAVDQISDPFNLLTMYGAAAIGWMIWTLVPRLYATAAAVGAQRRLNALIKARDAIIDEWGADIVMTSVQASPKSF